MAAPTSLPALLESLTQSFASVQEATSKFSAIDRPKDGISLLDVKNELLLSYLQNLVFLILLKLRNAKDDSTKKSNEIDEAVRSKLVELRLYLEKGARPLEEKLRFSIERFLSRAHDTQREESQKKHAKKINGHSDSESESDSGSGSEEEESDDDQDSVDETGNDRRPAPQKPTNKNKGAPRLGGLADDATVQPMQRGDDGAPTGVYRAPKRERVVMEAPASRRDKSDRRPAKSHTMDEFVASELSTAPLAEPSIGTTIVQGGRKMKTAREQADEAERRDYEENNFVRLPAQSKKDRAKKNRESGANNRMNFGGEEWHNLGEGIDRIDRLTKRKEGGRGSNVRAMLEKSRKRGIDTTDGPRGSGQIGERYSKRVKVLEGGRRDKGKNR
ncbi:hypothetical protein ACO1O0_003163 [Amphichorda felina]